MSHIDQVRHELAGLFGSRPVYHPLEELRDGDNSSFTGDFTCSPGELVIGGGQGEEPGFVVRKPVCTVAAFLNIELEHLEGGENASVAAAWEPFLEEHLFQPGVLDFGTWTTEDHVDFYRMCVSPGMPNAYDEDQSFEDWLQYSIGGFIFYAMPELCGDALPDCAELYGLLKPAPWPNILLLPANVPIYGNGQHAWDVTRRNASSDR